MTQNDNDTSRFWEFYALRYSVGAVLGALTLFFLVKQNQALASLIFVKEGEPVDIIQVGIFLGIGLVYSYLASAPILVFHTGRFMIPKSPARFLRGGGLSIAVCLAISAVPAILFMVLSSLDIQLKLWFAMVIFIASTIILGQLTIIYKCQSRRSTLFEFYKDLSTKRSAATGGMVDSYRHLREHGNAFAIVFFDIILALIIFAATIYPSVTSQAGLSGNYQTISTLTVVLMLWITPASLVWLIGCIIEQELIDS
ncbi:hypothetical protein [Pseudomonas sp. PS01301]|uniref:hypothetical protein n=1 Tax=Pseudomonas sp. PS01301 TaxID=2991437 RepID=UPI00249BB101|nr:hypothetical protein [Pseudomonas sp. PS01301]